MRLVTALHVLGMRTSLPFRPNAFCQSGFTSHSKQTHSKLLRPIKSLYSLASVITLSAAVVAQFNFYYQDKMKVFFLKYFYFRKVNKRG